MGTKTEKLSHNLLELSPDNYIRYYICFYLIKSLQKKKPCKILDVGGRCGIIGDFVRGEKLPYHVTVVDILPSGSSSTTCDKYIWNDITKLNFKNNYFDYVISCDVLEHIKDKNSFVQKILDIGKTVILTAPFESSQIHAAEVAANNFFKKFTGKDHPWLKEHFESQLPSKAWFERFIEKQGYYFNYMKSNNILNWLLFLLPNCLPEFFKVNLDDLHKINSYYNRNFKELGGLTRPCYHSIYIVQKSRSLSAKTEKITSKLMSEKIDREKHTKFVTKVFSFLTSEIRKREVALTKQGHKVQEMVEAMEAAERLKLEYLRKQLEVESIKEEYIKFEAFKKGIIWRSLEKYRRLKRWFFYGMKLIKKGILHPTKVFLGLKILLIQGPTALLLRLKKFLISPAYFIDINKQYRLWLLQHSLSKTEFNEQRKQSQNFDYRPKVSIITPVYNTREKWLKACIESVQGQTYDNWELCLADDASTKPYIRTLLKEYARKDSRIKFVFRRRNGHICRASNSALKLATGEYIALLDHDDELAPQALFKVVDVLNNDPSIDFIYSDEDKLELNGVRTSPFFKPDWSPDLLLSSNYICHFAVLRRGIVHEVGGFRPGFEGSQDYDLFLRFTEKTNKIFHIPDVLYSWRKVPGSTAMSYNQKSYANRASLKALEETLKRRHIKGTVEKGLIPGTFRIRYEIRKQPLISIIIPTRDKVEYLKRCVSSILRKTQYRNYEILIIDNGSEERSTREFYEKIEKNTQIKILRWNHRFNFSGINNFGVRNASGDFVVLLNNDTEVISPTWLEAMLEYAQRDEIGAVGAKLLYPNRTIQHCGIILGISGGCFGKGVAGHGMKGFIDDPIGFPYPKDIIRNYAAVTGACLMIEKKKYRRVHGLDTKFRIAFNDVDFCLKLLKNGYLNVYTPYSRLYHHESVSVGLPQAGTRNIEEFEKEIDLMHEKWGKLLLSDPFYNPNLTLGKEDFSLNI